jgi:hypothetical protein
MYSLHTPLQLTLGGAAGIVGGFGSKMGHAEARSWVARGAGMPSRHRGTGRSPTGRTPPSFASRVQMFSN